jgi:peptide-methionine (S)-S-oxide reductase
MHIRFRSITALVFTAILGFAACARANTPPEGGGNGTATTQESSGEGTRVAIFAGGCFWCMEHPFDELTGVVSTTVGYTGGHTRNPTYEEVSSGDTGHAEAVKVVYDPNRIGYEKLLDVFWHNVDPVAKGHQFCDWGDQYRAEIFYTSERQKRLAEASKAALARSGRFKRPITTQVVKAGPFYRAEDYHQDFYKKSPVRYRFYRAGCGRDRRLRELWGDEAP